jgi:ribonucleoside-diphosphate reductase beta chain
MADIRDAKQSTEVMSFSKKYNIFPISDETAYKSYIDLETGLWFPAELEYIRDIPYYESLKVKDSDGKNAKMKRLIDMSIGFLLPADGCIVKNIVVNFLVSASTFAEQQFFILQLYTESIHAMTYSLIAETLIKDSSEKKRIFEMVDNVESVKKQAELMEKYMNHTKYTKSEIYVAFAAAEGILFCTLFNIIYWFKSKNMFPNFNLANELIGKDETSHRNFGCNRFEKYNTVDNISYQRVIEIVDEFVNVEKDFLKELLPEDIEDLKQSELLKYVETVADNLIIEFKLDTFYKSKFFPTFMGDIGSLVKNNFYEFRGTNYQQYDKNKMLNIDVLVGNKKELDPLTEGDLIEF